MSRYCCNSFYSVIIFNCSIFKANNFILNFSCEDHSDENKAVPGGKSTSTRNSQKHSRQINTITLPYVRMYQCAHNNNREIPEKYWEY